MQVNKTPKSGYKIVKSGFRFNHTQIPIDWEMGNLGEICDVYAGNSAPQGEKYFDDVGIPFVRVYDLGNNNGEKFLRKTRDKIKSNIGKELGLRLYPKGSILLPKSGASTLLNYRMILDMDAYVASHLAILIPKKINSEYLFYFLSNFDVNNLTTKTSLPSLKLSEIKKISVPLPKEEEQKKMARVLSSVDSLIYKKQKIIEQIELLKKGLIQKLLIQGINHKNYRIVNMGKRFLNIKVPESWSVKNFSDIITIQNNRIDLDDSKEYTRIIVKRRHEGIVLRDIVTGDKILTKNQYMVRAGDFVISRRQIIHNACGLIPVQFDGAVVSNEYSSLSGSTHLHINYFDWFSQSSLFKKTIIVTTHGVDIEKYVFLLDEWLNLKMPLPSRDEQKRITKICSSIESKLLHEQKYKNELEILKNGLLQKLLTGKIRVKI